MLCEYQTNSIKALKYHYLSNANESLKEDHREFFLKQKELYQKSIMIAEETLEEDYSRPEIMENKSSVEVVS